MDDNTIMILNKLQRNDISFKKACKLLNKSEKEIDDLFDRKDYVYIPTLEDEKKLFKLEEKNIKELMKEYDKKHFQKRPQEW